MPNSYYVILYFFGMQENIKEYLEPLKNDVIN